MEARWTKRSAHMRRLPAEGSTFVRECWVLQCSDQTTAKDRAYRHPCPHCGAKIVSVHMPNGGWAHFEGASGLGSVKHPCLHRGEGLAKATDEKTGDLFDGRDA